MNSDGSITHWIGEVKEGNHEAAQNLWERYFSKMVRVARSQLSTSNRRVVDEEDVALSVFDKFCRAAESGRFPNLSDRDSFWRLLVKMTARKVVDQQRHQTRQRRGGGRVRGGSVFSGRERHDEQQVWAEVIGDSPSPEFVAMMSEQVERLLGHLEDPQLQQLLLGKMEGYSNKEIAKQMNCSERTIERRIKLIRAKCTEEFLN